MATMLNLDEVKPVDKTLKMNGKSHVLKPMSVGDFIAITQAAEAEAKSKEEVPLSKQIEQFVELAGTAFPTIPADELNALSLPQLTQIVEFARAGADDEEGDAEKK